MGAGMELSLSSISSGDSELGRGGLTGAADVEMRTRLRFSSSTVVEPVEPGSDMSPFLFSTLRSRGCSDVAPASFTGLERSNGVSDGDSMGLSGDD